MQKLILVLIITLFSSFLCQAQITANKVLLGGSAFFNSNNSENSSTSFTSFTITPSVVYMINNNIGLGLGIGYSSSNNEYKQSQNSTLSQSSNRFSFDPQIRYYKAIGGSENFYFFGQGTVFLGFGNEKNTDGSFSNSRSTNNFGAYISPNFAFLPSKRWALELGFTGIGYSVTDPEGDNNNTSSFNFGLSSFSPTIGIRAIF